eukprot:2176883-Pleurochrysis_carterae.AAC.4
MGAAHLIPITPWRGARVRGLIAPTGVAPVAALSGQRRPVASEYPDLGERSASVPQVRMRWECNLGNCSCECQTAAEGDSFRNRTARKGKKIVNRYRG